MAGDARFQLVTGGELERLVSVALFTGMRLSELLGLTWDAVDLSLGTIRVDKQLSPSIDRAERFFQSPKGGKPRTLTPAPSVIDALREQLSTQATLQLKAGPLWSNPHRLIFTEEDGTPLDQQRVRTLFHRLCAATGLEGFHFHDLRHTYAVNAIRAGDDIKTVQSNLGHATAAFTLDVYGHVTEKMKHASARRMEGFIKDVLNL